MALKLPTAIASKRDIIKIQREIERLMDERLQHNITKEQTGNLREMSNPSRLLKQLLELNEIVDEGDNLRKLMQNLESVRQTAPSVRISFASEPEHAVFEKVVEWFRREIDASLLVQVGVQPSIAGGCIVQTSANRYDFSLRTHLLNSVPKFTETMKRVE